jgi:hypothetical protein
LVQGGLGPPSPARLPPGIFGPEKGPSASSAWRAPRSAPADGPRAGSGGAHGHARGHGDARPALDMERPVPWLWT